MRESFVFYRSWFEAIEELPPKKAKELMLAIGKLALEGEDITEEIQDKIVKLLFKAYKPNIKANAKKYEAGKKGAHSRWNDKDITDEKQDNSTTDSREIASDIANEKQSDSKSDSNVNVNVNVNEEKEKKVNQKKETLLDKCKNDTQIKMLLQEIGKGEEFLKELIAYRRKIKKPFKSELGVKGVLKNLQNTSIATGKSTDDLFAIMQEREWLTVQADYLRRNKDSPKNSQEEFKQKANEAISKFASRAKGVEYAT